MRVLIQTRGALYFSDPIEDAIEEEWMEAFEAVLSNMRSLNYISLQVNGRERYFHPDNIEWIEVEP